MSTKTERIEALISADDRTRIDHAAQLVGQSVSAFLVSAAVEKAEHVIAESAVTTVPSDYFDRLLAAIDAVEPSPGLSRAAERARRRRHIR